MSSPVLEPSPAAVAPVRKPRPYVFLGQTTSMCETCLRLVPAKIIEEGQAVYYLKRCADLGELHIWLRLLATDALRVLDSANK